MPPVGQLVLFYQVKECPRDYVEYTSVSSYIFMARPTGRTGYRMHTQPTGWRRSLKLIVHAVGILYRYDVLTHMCI